MVDPIVSSYLNSNSAPASTTTGKSTLGKDDFMKLMIVQLKNQDPMNPTDSSQFSAQMAQFSSLEQLQNLNDNMTKSIDANAYLTQSINNTMTATLIGKEVKLTGSDFTNTGQDKTTLGFNLPSEPAATVVNIYNEAGTLVKTISNGNFVKGDNKLSWDFSDNQGNRLPEGKYSFKVEATDYKNAAITADTYMLGLINGVKYSDSGTVLLVNGSEYPLASVLEVVNPTGTP